MCDGTWCYMQVLRSCTCSWNMTERNFIIAHQHLCYRSSDSHCRSGLPQVREDQFSQLKPPFVSAPSHVFVSRHQPQAIVSVHVSHLSNWRQKKSSAAPRIFALTLHVVPTTNISTATRIMANRRFTTLDHLRSRKAQEQHKLPTRTTKLQLPDGSRG